MGLRSWIIECLSNEELKQVRELVDKSGLYWYEVMGFIEWGQRNWILLSSDGTPKFEALGCTKEVFLLEEVPHDHKTGKIYGADYLTKEQVESRFDNELIQSLLALLRSFNEPVTPTASTQQTTPNNNNTNSTITITSNTNKSTNAFSAFGEPVLINKIN